MVQTMTDCSPSLLCELELVLGWLTIIHLNYSILLFRKRRRKQAAKKQLQMRFEEAQLMHQPFQQDPLFGQFDQPAYGMDPGYGQPYYNEQTAMPPMGGEFYDYPMDNMGGPFAAAPAPPPPPPPPGPKPAQVKIKK